VAISAVLTRKAASETTAGADTVPEAASTASQAAEEGEWIARSRAGDREAFAHIYARYENGVFRHAYRLLEDADEADDVRQETFVRAYQSLSRFRGDSRVKTYLFAICGNLCRDRLRHRRRHPENGYGLTIPEGAIYLSDGGTTAGQDPLTCLQRATDAARVRNALTRLSPPDRELILLYHVEGMALDDIAVIVGCTRVSVPVRLFRARRRLRDVFLSLLHEEGE
jgi:RNA polymerase sigma-70 factor, ECF subfamily